MFFQRGKSFFWVSLVYLVDFLTLVARRDLVFKTRRGPSRATACLAVILLRRIAPVLMEKESLFAIRKGGGCRDLIQQLDVAKRGPAFFLQMAIRAREICMVPGTQRLMAGDGGNDITTELKANYAPGAIDTAYPEAAKFSDYRNAAKFWRFFGPSRFPSTTGRAPSRNWATFPACLRGDLMYRTGGIDAKPTEPRACWPPGSAGPGRGIA